jgi:hypothetical protein
MWLTGAGTTLSLFPLLLGWVSAVAGSPTPGVANDATTHYGGCTKPQVRREWQTLSDGDKAEWISAVKVSHFSDELGAWLPTLERFLTSDMNTVLGKGPA